LELCGEFDCSHLYTATQCRGRSMADVDGPDVANSVYGTLLRDETFDLDDVPYALDEGVQALREGHVSASRWASFIHMGA
jgi:hypothetical protein